MQSGQLFNEGQYTSMHGFQALPTRRRNRGISLPGEQPCSILCHHFGAAQPLPRSKVALAEVIYHLHNQVRTCCNGQSRMIGTPEWAAVNGGYRQHRQCFSQLLRLSLSMHGERIITSTDVTKFTIRWSFPMANED